MGKLFDRVRSKLHDDASHNLKEMKANWREMLDENAPLRRQDPKRGANVKWLLDQYNDALDKQITNASPLYHMEVPNFVIPGIVEDNKFKNQIESGASQGMLDETTRKLTSTEKFGYPDDEESLKNAEKYGFVTTRFPKRDELSWRHPYEYGKDHGYGYGATVFDFRPSNVKDRTTITIGDSLDEVDAGASPIILGDRETYANSIPVKRDGFDRAKPFDHDQMRMQRNRLLSTYRGGWVDPQHPRYLEAQYHGPLTLDDVSGVFYRRPGEYDFDYGEREMLEHASDEFGFPLYDESGCYRNCLDFDPEQHLMRR